MKISCTNVLYLLYLVYGSGDSQLIPRAFKMNPFSLELLEDPHSAHRYVMRAISVERRRWLGFSKSCGIGVWIFGVIKKHTVPPDGWNQMTSEYPCKQ